jgi:hypothetical protein
MANAKGTETAADTVTFKPMSTAKGDIKYVSASRLAKGDIAVEGIYIGTQPNTLEPTKLDFRFEDRKDRSKITVVNQAGNLKTRMQAVNPGDLIQVVYMGKEKVTKGKLAGKEVHQFELNKG